MNKLSPERRNVVLLCSAVAAMSGLGPLLKHHPVAFGLWMTALVVMLVFAIAGLIKLKRQGQ